MSARVKNSHLANLMNLSPNYRLRQKVSAKIGIGLKTATCAPLVKIPPRNSGFEDLIFLFKLSHSLHTCAFFLPLTFIAECLKFTPFFTSNKQTWLLGDLMRRCFMLRLVFSEINISFTAWERSQRTQWWSFSMAASSLWVC